MELLKCLGIVGLVHFMMIVTRTDETRNARKRCILKIETKLKVNSIYLIYINEYKILSNLKESQHANSKTKTPDLVFPTVNGKL